MNVFEEKGLAFSAAYHDNAHPALVICGFCTKNDMKVLYQPPYSPDLAPINFFILQHQSPLMEENLIRLVLFTLKKNTYLGLNESKGSVMQKL